jgi:hypothetical protein
MKAVKVPADPPCLKSVQLEIGAIIYAAASLSPLLLVTRILSGPPNPWSGAAYVPSHKPSRSLSFLRDNGVRAPAVAQNTIGGDVCKPKASGSNGNQSHVHARDELNDLQSQ